MSEQGPIGIFDSGYGGLTIFKEIKKRMDEYDFIYLGDNARAPYGTRSSEIVHRYTLEAVQFLFSQGCHLVILACNTASAMALRNIQQLDLPKLHSKKRVLGVLRPTTELISELSQSGFIGICATQGTVDSSSYLIEASKYAPDVQVYQQACPLWVPLIENEELDSIATQELVAKYLKELLAQDNRIDAVLLACTHYPLLKEKIVEFLPEHIELISQGPIVASSLVDYLKRHPEMDDYCSKNSNTQFLTTGDTAAFDTKGSLFFGSAVKSSQVEITSSL